jgi:uncharacterized glyoxalase superfamily protein PhnB
MMRSNRSMLAADVIPVLNYADVRAAVAWLERAFGFRERLAIADHRSQMTWAGGAVVVASAAPGLPAPAAHSVMVRVTDIDAHCAHARSHGARIVNEPTTYPYGERQYTAVDPDGHVWTFSESVDDVDPAAWGGTLLA